MTRGRPAPTYLLLSDDESRRTTIRDKLRKHGTVRVVADANAARAEVEGTKRAFAGVVIDVQEATRAVQRLLRELARANPAVPALLIVGEAAEDVDCDDGTFRCVDREAAGDELRAFVGRGLALAIAEEAHVADVVEELGRTRGLTAKQMELVALSTMPIERKALVEGLGVSQNTLKTRVRQLLRIFGEDTMDSLGKAVLRAALRRASGSEPRALPVPPAAPAKPKAPRRKR
ncbi:MAG: hypothetical protein U0230_02890 [Polyangiales bacterium]